MIHSLFFVPLPINFESNSPLENTDIYLKKETETYFLHPKLKEKKYPVVFIANGIGDGFLALPTIRALTQCYPYQLTLIYDNVISPVWLYDLPFKSIILIEVLKKNGNLIFDFNSVAKIINQCDLFISLNFGEIKNIRALSNLLNPEYSIGFDTYFNFKLSQNSEIHASRSYFEVLELIEKDYDIKKYSYPPSILKTEEFVVSKLIEYINSTHTKNFKLAIHTDTQPNKMWQEWSPFITLFLNNFPDAVILVLGTTHNFEIQGKRVFDFTRFPFSISMGLLSYCDAFIGIDSCLLHVADLLNIMGIGLFFSSEQKSYGFYNSKYHLNLLANQFNQIDPISVLDAFCTIIKKKMAFAEYIT